MKNRYNYFIISILVLCLFLCFFLTSLCDKTLSVKENYNKGQELINEKKQGEAIPYFEKAVKIDPNYAKAYFKVGWCKDMLKKYEEAIEAYKEAIRVYKNYVSAYNNLGLDYKKLGRYEEAIEPLKEAIKINPKYSNAHYNLGLVYHELGEKDTAMKEYEILKELNAGLAEQLLKTISE